MTHLYFELPINDGSDSPIVWSGKTSRTAHINPIGLIVPYHTSVINFSNFPKPTPGTSRNSGELELHYCQGSFLGQAKSKPTCQKSY